MPRLARVTLICSTLAACTTTPTQTVVRFEAAASLDVPPDATIRFLHFAHDVPLHEEPERIGEFAFHDGIAVPVEPRDGDATRRFTLLAELLSGGARISWARVRTGFVEGELMEVRVALAAGCPAPSDLDPPGGPVCGSHDTCAPGPGGSGVCAPSCYAPEPFASDGAGGAHAPAPCEGSDCLAVERIESTFDASCALAEGRLFCWGRLVPSDTPQRRPSWVRDGSGLATHDPARPWSGLAFGARHLCALRDGALHCGGSDFEGQLGNGPGGNEPCCVSTPASTTATLPSFVSVVAEGDYTCALDDSGRLWCSGENRILDRVDQTFVDVGLTDLRDAAAGRMFTCAATDSAIRCHGSGALLPGDGMDIPWSGGVLEARAETLCAIAPDGVARCWGHDAQGRPFAEQPNVLPGRHDAIALASARFAEPAVRCAIDADEGRLRCWGENDDGGRLGVPPSEAMTVEISDALELEVDSPGDVSLGERHGCAVDRGGRLFCWGANDLGQLGVDGPSRSEPREVCVPSF